MTAYTKIRTNINCKFIKKLLMLVKKHKSVSVINAGYGFLNTIEGCTLINYDRAIYEVIKAVFDELPDSVKHFLALAINDGSFVERAEAWKEFIKLTDLTEKQQHKVMVILLNWYIHIKQARQQEDKIK